MNTEPISDPEHRFRLLIAHGRRLAELYSTATLPARLRSKSTTPGFEGAAGLANNFDTMLDFSVMEEHRYARALLAGDRNPELPTGTVRIAHTIEQLGAVLADDGATRPGPGEASGE